MNQTGIQDPYLRELVKEHPAKREITISMIVEASFRRSYDPGRYGPRWFWGARKPQPTDGDDITNRSFAIITPKQRVF